MSERTFESFRLPADEDRDLWELFHENSKLSPFGPTIGEAEVAARMMAMEESHPYDGYPTVQLPQPVGEISTSLSEAVRCRTSPQAITPEAVSLDSVGTILHHAYGVTREGSPANPRGLRTSPSAGALYPLEIYVYSEHIEGCPAGLFHYYPPEHALHILREGAELEPVAEAMIFSPFALNASMLLFISAVFERSTFKYGARGYRFVYLEAGHVGQNINLAATSMGLGVLNIGGYFDRMVDEFLELDGVTESVVYVAAIGCTEAS